MQKSCAGVITSITSIMSWFVISYCCSCWLRKIHTNTITAQHSSGFSCQAVKLLSRCILLVFLEQMVSWSFFPVLAPGHCKLCSQQGGKGRRRTEHMSQTAALSRSIWSILTGNSSLESFILPDCLTWDAGTWTWHLLHTKQTLCHWAMVPPEFISVLMTFLDAANRWWWWQAFIGLDGLGNTPCHTLNSFSLWRPEHCTAVWRLWAVWWRMVSSNDA